MGRACTQTTCPRKKTSTAPKVFKYFHSNFMPIPQPCFSHSMCTYILLLLHAGFDIGPTGSPTLLNCVAYKLCYYKFDQVQTEYGRPPGKFRRLNIGPEGNLCRLLVLKSCNLNTVICYLAIMYAGFDRARNRQVGGTNIVLTTMEEAFTSEHWIVRIYKVKKR